MRKKTILEAQKKTGKVTPDKYKELLQNSQIEPIVNLSVKLDRSFLLKF